MTQTKNMHKFINTFVKNAMDVGLIMIMIYISKTMGMAINKDNAPL